MSNRTITMDEVGDLAAKPGSRSWAVAVKGEILSALHNVESSADHLEGMIKLMEEKSGYQALGFSSFDEFCAAPPPSGLGKTKISINIEVTQRKTTQTLAETAQPLAVNGGDRQLDECNNQGNDYHLDSIKQRGDNAKYLTARIARDNPDILGRNEAGRISQRKSRRHCSRDH